MRKKVLYFDMDGVLTDFHSQQWDNEKVRNREWIANLPAFNESIKLVKSLISQGYSIYINSLAANEDAKQGKYDWLSHYLPEIKKSHIIISVGYARKAAVRKTKTGILIDDKLSNCKQWIKDSGNATVYVAEKGKINLKNIYKTLDELKHI